MAPPTKKPRRRESVSRSRSPDPPRRDSGAFSAVDPASVPSSSRTTRGRGRPAKKKTSPKKKRRNVSPDILTSEEAAIVKAEHLKTRRAIEKYNRHQKAIDKCRKEQEAAARVVGGSSRAAGSSRAVGDSELNRASMQRALGPEEEEVEDSGEEEDRAFTPSPDDENDFTLSPRYYRRPAVSVVEISDGSSVSFFRQVSRAFSSKRSKSSFSKRR